MLLRPVVKKVVLTVLNIAAGGWNCGGGIWGMGWRDDWTLLLVERELLKFIAIRDGGIEIRGGEEHVIRGGGGLGDVQIGLQKGGVVHIM